MAIKRNSRIKNIIKKLSKYAARIKNSINLVQGHINKKAKLFIDNKTRWLSAFLMLRSFLNAYEKKAFPSNDPCPVSKTVIEKYVQLLLPAYQFNLIMQKNNSSIADVVPSFKIMFSKWSRFQVNGEYKTLCKFLISAFTQKFEYELNSNFYQVSSLLNTSMLKHWYYRSDCSQLRTAGFECVEEVAKILLKKLSKSIF